MLNTVFRSSGFAPVRIPGPAAPALLGWRGNLLRLMQSPIGYLRSVWRNHGNLAAITENDPTFVCAFGPEHNRVLFSDDRLFEQYFSTIPAPPNSALERMTRNALVLNGVAHRSQRRIMTPPFQRRRAESYRDEMVLVAERALEPWRSGQRIELTSALRHVTLGTILALVFGVNAGENPNLFAHAEELLGRFLTRMGSVMAIVFPVDFPHSPYRQLLDEANRVEELVRELLRHTSSSSDSASIPGQLAAANRNVNSDDPNADLIGQLVTLLLAGQETTNNALAWTLFLLAQHPAILADLHDELSAELRGDAPTLAQLEKLPLLDAVIRESLRLLPPAANGARRATEPFSLGGYDLPKGSVVIFSEYVSHHLPEVFPNPEDFIPARWNGRTASAFEYFPFGTGGRACLGNHFATLEMKLALALIVQRYWPEVEPGTRIDFILKPALAPRAGLPVRLHPPRTRIRRATVHGQIHDAVKLTG